MIVGIRSAKTFGTQIEELTNPVVDFFIRIEMTSAAESFIKEHPLLRGFKPLSDNFVIETLNNNEIAEIKDKMHDIYLIPYGNGLDKSKKSKDVLDKQLYERLSLVLNKISAEQSFVCIRLDYLVLITDNSRKGIKILDYLASFECKFLVFI